jgi:hypothetical protein
MIGILVHLMEAHTRVDWVLETLLLWLLPPNSGVLSPSRALSLTRSRPSSLVRVIHILFLLVRHLHAQASVASTLISAASLLRPFAHEDSSLASDLTMSFWPSSSAAVGGGVPSPLAMGDPLLRQQYVPSGSRIPPTATMGGAIPPPVPVPMGGIPVGGTGPPQPTGGFPMGGPIPHQVPLPHQPTAGATLPPASLPMGGGFPSPAAPVPSIRSVEPFKLPQIKDAKSCLDLQSIIQYYLRLLERFNENEK